LDVNILKLAVVVIHIGLRERSNTSLEKVFFDF
jgi:hypothetical protein